MTKSISQSYVLSEEDIVTIKEKAKAMGDASDSAALRVIIREWADLKVKATVSMETVPPQKKE